VGSRTGIAEDELLAADLQTVAVDQTRCAEHASPVYGHPVAAAEILDDHELFSGHDARMLTRDQSVIERKIALRCPPDCRYAER
jgi:hypothetical protein